MSILSAPSIRILLSATILFGLSVGGLAFGVASAQEADPVPGNSQPSVIVDIRGVGLEAVVTVLLADADGDAVTAVLTWGDGTSLALGNPGGTYNHTYAAPGRYTVNVVSSDANGLAGRPKGGFFHATAHDSSDALAVSTGEGFNCALLVSGNVHCWGRNHLGQTEGYSGGDAVGVASGDDHACALLASGNVACWGSDTLGQAADYSGGDATALSAASYYTCALLSSGNVHCWGTTPGPVTGYDGGDAVAISTDHYHACTLLSSGNVHCWGDENSLILGGYSGGDAIAVGTGSQNACVLISKGDVVCWGSNEYLQNQGYEGGDAVAVSVGPIHACALLATGDVECWGGANSEDINYMNYIYGAGYSGRDAVTVDSSFAHNCAVLTSGDVHCWGKNSYGQAMGFHGVPDDAPPATLMVTGTGPSAQATIGVLNASLAHTMTLDWGDGTVQTLTRGGTYRHTYLSDGTFTVTLTPMATDGATGSQQTGAFEARALRPLDAVDVSVATSHVCALLASGDVSCWVIDYYGDTHSALEGYLGGDAIAVSIGSYHNCALLTSGNIECWGEWNFGASADYTGGDAIAVSVGSFHTCALLATGNVHCWGEDENSGNYNGQTIDYMGGDAIAVSAGQQHTCIALASGNVRCVGYGHHGETMDYSGGGAVAVSAGSSTTCILLAWGNVMCWGVTVNEPTIPYTGGDAVAVGTDGFKCVLLASGTSFCPIEWHWNNHEDTWYTQGDAVAMGVGSYIRCLVIASGELHCSDAYGSSGSIAYSGAPDAPTAHVSLSGTGLAADLLVELADTDGDIVDGLIDWGDGSEPSPIGGYGAMKGFFEYRYAAPRTYTITVTLVDETGLSGAPQVRTFVATLGGPAAIAVESGRGSPCVLLETADIHCWGGTWHYGRTVDYNGGDALAVSPGSMHTCALLTSGNVHCWGDNTEEQAVGYTGGDAVAVASGYSFTCALLTSGNVHCWGDIGRYTGGYGAAEGYFGGDAIAVGAGSTHACALTSTGNVHCWGGGAWSADYGQTAPYLGGNAVKLTVGDVHNCVLLTSGNVHCWGYNDSEQAAGYTGGDAVAVSAGYTMTCALLATGNVDCWGFDSHFTDYQGGDAVGVAAGDSHMCVLRTSADVRCAGSIYRPEDTYGYDGPADAPTASVALYETWHHAVIIEVTLADNDLHDTVTATIDWGDGTTEAIDHMGSWTYSHEYPEPGVYTITVTPVDNWGLTGDGATLVHEEVNTVPTAELQWVTLGNHYVTVQMWVNETDGDSVEAFIDWGDGTVEEAWSTSRSHTYAAHGTYTIRLEAVDQHGASTFTTLVYDGENRAPVAILETSGWDHTITAVVTLTDENEDYVQATLDWGDGTVETIWYSGTYTHTYATSGEYTITVTPTDEHDLSGRTQFASFQAATPVPDAPVFEAIVNVYSGYYSDTATFGARYDATHGYDYGIDFAEPPAPPGDFVRAYFTDGGPGTTSRLDRSFLHAEAPIEWAFVVERLDRSAGESGTWVYLYWSAASFAGFYETFDVFLIDGATVVNMRTQESYAYETPGGDPHHVHEMVIRVVERSTMVASFDIPLHAGWNLFSLPVLPEDASVAAIFAGLPVEIVYAADRTVPEVLEPGRAYWVLAAADTVVHVVGAVLERVETEPLSAGWHLVGGPTGADAAVEVSGSAESTLWTYVADAAGRRYEQRAARTQPGEGYWIFVHDEGTRLTIRRETTSA